MSSTRTEISCGTKGIHQVLDCSPTNRERELGLDRRETVREEPLIRTIGHRAWLKSQWREATGASAPQRHVPLVIPAGWTILAGRLEALFPTGRRVESFADDLNTRRGIIRPSHLKHFPELARTTQEGYIPHLAWATRRAGAKSVFLKPKVETKSLTMWCAASPLAMPHGALAWCPVCGSWSAVVGCFVHGVWFLVRDPEC
ncbi:hypothetical protein Lal_00031723 [Lupinus albus]|nr:hypothetical protein Lal_00031723 [Lupinus albus]